jgi:3-hydroxy-3-methylglutaryl CoA synthase
MDLTIHGIGLAPCQSLSLDRLSERAQRAASVASLLEDGFSDVAQSDLDLAALGGLAIQNSLEAAGIAREEVEAVVFCTESFWDDCSASVGDDHIPRHRRLHEAMLRALFLQSGLVRAYPYATWGAACANLSSVLALASALIRSGQYERVLAVLVDRQPPWELRVQQGPSGPPYVYADSGASFFVGPASSGYRLKHILVEPAWRPYRALSVDRNGLAAGKEWAAALRSFAKRVGRATGTAIADYPRILTQNFHSTILDASCKALGVSRDRLCLPTKATAGHAFSGDIVAGLACLLDDRSARGGEKLGLLDLGPWTFGFAEVEIG